MRAHAEGRVGHPLGKNPGDVWRIPTAGFRGAHFAVFPERLIERPLLAGCPERTCANCGAPWLRPPGNKTAALAASCACQASWLPGLVLDPFIGAGTVGVVARRLGRDWLGIELNPDYAALATERIKATPPGRAPP
jgi:DNA modification methylase